MNYKEIIEKYKVDIALIPEDTKFKIEEHEAITNTNSRAYKKENGELTGKAQNKLRILNKDIVNELADYIAERDNIKPEKKKRTVKKAKASDGSIVGDFFAKYAPEDEVEEDVPEEEEGASGEE